MYSLFIEGGGGRELLWDMAADLSGLVFEFLVLFETLC